MAFVCDVDVQTTKIDSDYAFMLIFVTPPLSNPVAEL